MTDHEHTPEIRKRQHYNPEVIPGDAWVCAECEVFLGWVVKVTGEDRGFST